MNLRTRFRLASVGLLAMLAACASSNKMPDVPYPAFVSTGEIPEQFLAALPGIRARVYSSDMRTRTMSARVDIPRDWKGTTGGDPGKSLEIFVLAGELQFSDFKLGPGGYAYVPPGSLGFSLVSDDGAQVLYFLDEVDPSSVIRSPVILDSKLVDWHPVGQGLSERSLRDDPGSGARSWLLRIEPGAVQAWEASGVAREGYLVRGQYRHSECVAGVPVVADYPAGGYFRRPPMAFNGGPESVATTETVWFLRELEKGETQVEAGCY